MTNVKTRWNGDDSGCALAQGWHVYQLPPSRLGLARAVRSYSVGIVGEFSPVRQGGRVNMPLFSSVDEAITHIMTQMLAGDALCYKAMRIVCKTNPAYESYKPMVREVRKKYGW